MEKFFLRILDILFPARKTERIVRELGDTWGTIESDSTEIPGFPPITALRFYRDENVRALILETKFHGNMRAAKFLGQILAHHLLGFLEDEGAFSSLPLILIPLPLSKQRFRSRGYNQSVRICNEALPYLTGAACVEICLLKRTRNTTPQTTLTKDARLQNMDRAFNTVGTVSLDTTYIVVDDVTTTGATLRAAYTALIEAGAKDVHLVALAH